MDQIDKRDEMARIMWGDHNSRQEFEHTLIDRKTTWLLSTQAILFAAYGLSLDERINSQVAAPFRSTVPRAGIALAVITLLGVMGLINSKRLSWLKYRDYFMHTSKLALPPPWDGKRLPWGIRTGNTVLTLLPDVLLPVVFIAAWAHLV